MVNATFASLSTPPGIYYVCHIFTPQYLHICDIFTESKFVQIHFFIQCEVCLVYPRKFPFVLILT